MNPLGNMIWITVITTMSVVWALTIFFGTWIVLGVVLDAWRKRGK